MMRGELFGLELFWRECDCDNGRMGPGMAGSNYCYKSLSALDRLKL
jgi:hypothetical protein